MKWVGSLISSTVRTESLNTSKMHIVPSGTIADDIGMTAEYVTHILCCQHLGLIRSQ